MDFGKWRKNKIESQKKPPTPTVVVVNTTDVKRIRLNVDDDDDDISDIIIKDIEFIIIVINKQNRIFYEK